MASNQPQGGRLPVLVNLNTGERFPINGPNVTLGRAPDNHIVLTADPYCSGHHAKVYWDQGGWWVTDMNSSNGTTVNDELIVQPRKLAPRDVIKVGRTKFSIE